MNKETYFSRVRQIVSEARATIEELKDSDIDWSGFNDGGTVVVYDHFEGNPIEVEIDGIKGGRLVINKLYAGETGETASLDDIEEMSACIIADYMLSMQNRTNNKSL